MEQNQSPLVSVIVPVWNPGPGILRCIESLRSQTLTDIEMIFVDDCGTDDSMDKVRAAAIEDSRIRIIENEKNIGAGPSRNRGIEVAQGEYLSFVDPDDYVAPDFLEVLYIEARNHSLDIVKGRIVHIKEDGSLFSGDRELNARIRKGLLAKQSLYTLFTYEHHSAIYRKDLIISQNICYGISSRAQDTTFLLKVCSNAKRFSIIDSAKYYFCARPNSAMHTMDATRLMGFLQSISEQFDYVLTKIPIDNEAVSFLQGKILMGLQELFRYNRISGMEDAARSYLLGLRKEMERVKLSVNHSFPLRILRDYSVALPTKPSYSPWEAMNPPIRYAELVQCWVDFYLSSPKERNDCRKELSKLIIAANKAVNGKPHSTYTKEEQKQGKMLLHSQIKRLPFDLQLQIELLKNHTKYFAYSIFGKQ